MTKQEFIDQPKWDAYWHEGRIDAEAVIRMLEDWADIRITEWIMENGSSATDPYNDNTIKNNDLKPEK